MASAFRQAKTALAGVPRRAARGLVTVYRYTFSPLVGFHCRHLPTCSAYADQALERCHPFGTSGLDVVADALPPDARWYAPWRYARWRGTNPGPPTPTSGL